MPSIDVSSSRPANTHPSRSSGATDGPKEGEGGGVGSIMRERKSTEYNQRDRRREPRKGQLRRDPGKSKTGFGDEGGPRRVIQPGRKTVRVQVDGVKERRKVGRGNKG
jgi:hypothetical protein